MPRLLRLLPSAIVAVAESEKSEYQAVVPAKQLIFHHDLPRLVDIRTWINQTIQEDCLMMVDDDFLGVIPQVVRLQRRVTDPAIIEQVIENAHQCTEDLGLTVFCWTRTRNNFLADPEMLPIRLVQPMAGSFGMRGAAQSRRFDAVPDREDVDFTLQTLLHDRVLFAEMRWYFDHGRSFAGRGGNVGKITEEQFKASTAILLQRWGKYIGLGSPGFQKNRSTTPMSIRVKRRSPLADANSSSH